ncbi:hypothetical protein TELCIR_00203 [Teladorsagia circumcincta]|uniref:C2 NT-type domain-containing protein n=1 Tax=Teladorsagia circumcincta TaxID=45464 RepID=A0A2G9V560_TELCI|nr:hypothetical protein TELCIR_00203 [Teladorsagia circumcincta]
MWPEQAAEHIDILTTLYKSQHDDQFDDKEWTIVVEEVTSKGRRRPIAAVPLNIRLFIMDFADQKSELKLKLRPLVPQLKQCNLMLLLSSQLLKEGFKDDVSLASTVSHNGRDSREQSVCDALNASEEQVDHGDAKKELALVANKIQSQSWSSDTKKVPKTAPIAVEEAEQSDSRSTPGVQQQAAGSKNDSFTGEVNVVQPQRQESESSAGHGSAGGVRPHWRVPSEEKASKERETSPTKPTLSFFEALVVARAMGINDIPDENDILTPDSKIIKLLLER